MTSKIQDARDNPAGATPDSFDAALASIKASHKRPVTRRTKSKNLLALAHAVKRRGRTYNDKVRNPVSGRQGGEGIRRATQHVRDQIIGQYHVEAAKHPDKSKKQMVTHLYKLFTTPPLGGSTASGRALLRDGRRRLFECSRATVSRTLQRYLQDSKSTP